MRNIIYYISISVLLIFNYSCTTEVDDLFDQTATERLDANVRACKDLLISASNGWVIEYYPEELQSYGGFAVLAKFDENGEVTVSSEIAREEENNQPNYLTYTSHYSILTSNSAVLSFDTYNYIFHYFADPDYGNGASYDGDFEFTYISGTDEEIIFRGTKTGNKIVFRALNENTDWVTYLDGVYQVQEKIAESPYSSFIWNKGAPNEIEFDLDELNNVFRYVPDNSNPDVWESIGFCYTPTGINLYKEIEMGGTPVQDLRWEEGKLLSEATNIELIAGISDNYIPYETFIGNWVLYYNNGNTQVNVFIEENKKGSSLTLKGLKIGTRGYNVELGYSKKTGKLSMLSQYMGTYDQYYVYLCPWDIGEGTLTWTEGSGYDLIYDDNTDKPELTFVDNGKWSGYNVTGIMFFAFSSPSPSNGSAEGYLVRFQNLVKLVKNN